VRELNDQGIPDKEISILFERSPSYVGKVKNRWRKQGLWQGPNRMTKEPSKEKRGERNVSPSE
ncbi:helix-turn-helix domain-containing protein, partial [Bacillus thuringiensis]